MLETMFDLFLEDLAGETGKGLSEFCVNVYMLYVSIVYKNYLQNYIFRIIIKCWG